MQLTLREAAQVLNVPEKTVYGWIDDGEIPHHRVDGQVRFNRSELLEWANVRKLQVSPVAYRSGDAQAPVPGIAEALQEGGILRGLPGDDKPAVLRAMVDALPLPDRETLYQVLMARERLGSTAVGHGIAIPHVRSPIIAAESAPRVALFFLKHPIDFGAADGQPVKTMFWLVSPTVTLHTYMLAKIASLIRDPQFLSALERQAPDDAILKEARRVEASMAAPSPGKA